MIKKIIFLSIPIICYSQISYKDVMSLSDVKQFKRIMIENNYEFDSEDDDWIVYGYDIKKDSLENTSSKWGGYSLNDDMFMLQFSKDGFFGVLGENDEILEEVKKNCTYYDIIEYENSGGEVNDYVCYSCIQSKYKGKIGFMISEGSGYIRHFPNN